MADLLKNIAVFIDADNVNDTSLLKEAMEKISFFGRISLKKAYGDWTKPCLSPWKQASMDYAINLVMQADYVSGKNVSDIKIAIEAMDALHSGIYDGIALVSGDSDFTPLAMRIHERGLFVLGLGTSLAIQPLRKAFDEYIVLGEAKPSPKPKTKRASSPKDKKKEKEAPIERNALDEMLSTFYDLSVNLEKPALLSGAGYYIKRLQSDFSIRDYGAKSLSDYIKMNPDKYDIFDPNTPVTTYYPKF